MSSVSTEHAYSRTYFNVNCSCGKTLRAKHEMAGTEIRCWSCHQMVPVPIPRSAEQTLSALRQEQSALFPGKALVVLGMAAALTGLLAVSYRGMGIALATAGLIAAAYAYGELVRRSGEGEVDYEDDGARQWPRPRQLAARVMAAGLLGLSLAAPFWLAPYGLGQAARLSGLSLAVLPIALIVAPLATMIVRAHDRQGPLPWRHTLATMRRHPYAILLALAVVPLAAIAAEALLLTLSYHFHLLPFLLLDLYPRPETHLRMFHLPLEVSYSFWEPVNHQFVPMYFHRLREGYTLIGAVTPSLPVPKNMYLSPWTLDMEFWLYLLVRSALTIVSTTVILLALALQASWLGRIAALDRRPTRATVPEQVEVSPTALV